MAFRQSRQRYAPPTLTGSPLPQEDTDGRVLAKGQFEQP